jgi:hypothetical protein
MNMTTRPYEKGTVHKGLQNSFGTNQWLGEFMLKKAREASKVYWPAGIIKVTIDRVVLRVDP